MTGTSIIKDEEEIEKIKKIYGEEWHRFNCGMCWLSPNYAKIYDVCCKIHKRFYRRQRKYSSV